MTPEDAAAELDVLASRVRRMSLPLASNPNRFHEGRSDIAKDLADLARRVWPRGRPASGVTVDFSDIRREADHHHRPDRQWSSHRGAEAQSLRRLRW